MAKKNTDSIPINLMGPPIKNATPFSEFMNKLGVTPSQNSEVGIGKDGNERTDESNDLMNTALPLDSIGSLSTKGHEDSKQLEGLPEEKINRRKTGIQEVDLSDDESDDVSIDLDEYISQYLLTTPRHSQVLKRLYIPKEVHKILLLIMAYSELEGIESNLQKFMTNILKQHFKKHAKSIRQMKRRVLKSHDLLDL